MPTTVAHRFNREPAVYAPGEEILLTVAVAPHDPEPVTGIIRTVTTIVMPDGTESETLTTESPYVVDGKPGTARTSVISDSAGRTWTKVSENAAGTEAVFRTVA